MKFKIGDKVNYIDPDGTIDYEPGIIIDILYSDEYKVEWEDGDIDSMDEEDLIIARKETIADYNSRNLKMLKK